MTTSIKDNSLNKKSFYLLPRRNHHHPHHYRLQLQVYRATNRNQKETVSTHFLNLRERESGGCYIDLLLF